MSNLVVQWDTETYEVIKTETLKQSVNTMALLHREQDDVLIVAARETLYFYNPETLEQVKKLETKFWTFVSQIVGLQKFKNEYFIIQDLYANLKVIETSTGNMIMEIKGQGLELFTIVSNSVIELVDPYNKLQPLSEEEYKNQQQSDTEHVEMEEENTAMIATTVPIKGGCALAIYSIDPINQESKIIKVMNKKGKDISKGFSILQLKGGILAYSNFGKIEIVDAWDGFKVLKTSINKTHPEEVDEVAPDYVRKMVIVEKRRKTNALKEHPLGSYSLLTVGYRTELNLWNVDFKEKEIEMYKAEASRKLKHRKSVLDVALINNKLITCSVDSTMHLYDINYRY